MRNRSVPLGLAVAWAAVGCTAIAPRGIETAPPTAVAPAWRVPDLGPPPSLTPADIARRVAALADGLPEGGAALIEAGRAPEQDYEPFRPDPNFAYLTGLRREPEAVLLVQRTPSGPRAELFVRRRNPAREIWEDPALGPVEAQRLTGLPTSPIDEPRTAARLDSMRSRLVDPQPRLAALRAVKTPVEIDRLRRAVVLTVLAHREAMRALQPGLHEFELAALIEYTFRRYGADGPAFQSIVGGGPNATVLHHPAGDRPFGPDELVVVDVGAAYDGYAADLTRTLPTSGRFTPRQRELYTVVLAAQKAVEADLRPGATWAQLTRTAIDVLARGLTRLGLVDGPDATYDCRPGWRCPQWQLFFPHGLGHGIGLEVHDPTPPVLQPNMVVTIEPGIYVAPSLANRLPDTPDNRALRSRREAVWTRYAGLGVRLEDNYLVTPDGAERLSAALPREIHEVEAALGGSSPHTADRQPAVLRWRLP